MAKETGKISVQLSDRTVEIREPLVRDVRLLQSIKDPEAKELKLESNLTGLAHDELDALTLKDYGALQKALADFLS
jgi:hypothetical protein